MHVRSATILPYRSRTVCTVAIDSFLVHLYPYCTVKAIRRMVQVRQCQGRRSYRTILVPGSLISCSTVRTVRSTNKSVCVRPLTRTYCTYVPYYSTVAYGGLYRTSALSQQGNILCPGVYNASFSTQI